MKLSLGDKHCEERYRTLFVATIAIAKQHLCAVALQENIRLQGSLKGQLRWW